MVRTRSRAEAAHALFEFAIAATRPPTEEATAACNMRITRARDFLAHSPPQDVVIPRLKVDPETFEELRTEALAQLRHGCATCGLCKRFGLEQP